MPLKTMRLVAMVAGSPLVGVREILVIVGLRGAPVACGFDPSLAGGGRFSGRREYIRGFPEALLMPSMAQRFWPPLAPVSTSCRAVRPSKSGAFRLLRRPGTLHSGKLCLPSMAQRFRPRLTPVLPSMASRSALEKRRFSSASQTGPHPIALAIFSGVAGKNGWGGWTRTNECKDQNLVPYHLATPQHVDFTSFAAEFA